MLIAYKKKAEVTVFLTLLFTIICSLVYVVIFSARVHCAKVYADQITDGALSSALSEYNVYLYENYGIIFVDTTYHGGMSGDKAFAAHIESYISECIMDSSSATLPFIELKEVEVVSSQYADDNGYEALLNELIACEAAYGVIGSDSMILDSYAASKFGDDFFDDVCSFREKKEMISNRIEEDVRNNSNSSFRMYKCLYKANICAKYKTIGEIEFEIYK